MPTKEAKFHSIYSLYGWPDRVSRATEIEGIFLVTLDLDLDLFLLLQVFVALLQMVRQLLFLHRRPGKYMISPVILFSDFSCKAIWYPFRLIVLEESAGPQLSSQFTTKTLIRLGACLGQSESQ